MTRASDAIPSATAILASFAAGLRFDDIPSAVVQHARRCLLDAIGVMLAAVTFCRRDGQGELKHYIDLAATDGPSTLVGQGKSSSPAIAAFVNGTLSEALDWQDTNLAARIHNGSAAIPAALALSQKTNASGAEILAALVAGYEVGSRLSMAIQPAHWHRGFQATGTIGTCGAAISAGRMMRLDKNAMTDALGIAGFILPVSNSDNFFKGYSIKPVHGGQAAACGVECALLAAAGYHAGPLEGEPPRHHAILRTLGDGEPDVDRSLSGLGNEWHMLEVAFKPYPAGLLNVGPIQLTLELVRAGELRADAIERIDVRTFREAALFTGAKYTTACSNFIDAHLSLPFCVATAAIDGEFTARQLLKSRIADVRIHELASRVKVVEGDGMSNLYPRYWPVEMAFRLRNGATIVRRIDEVDWSPRRPASWEALCEKFLVTASEAIGKEKAQRVIEEVQRFDHASSSHDLMALCTGQRQLERL